MGPAGRATRARRLIERITTMEESHTHVTPAAPGTALIVRDEYHDESVPLPVILYITCVHVNDLGAHAEASATFAVVATGMVFDLEDPAIRLVFDRINIGA